MDRFLNIRHFHKIALFFATLFFSCNSQQEISEQTIIKDDLNRELRITKDVKHVMALAPSVTEMLYLICDDEQIVGRTPYCNYPPRVKRKPVVNNYPVDYEQLLLLKPDLVFVKDGMISMEQASKIESMGIPVYFQQYEKVEDIFTGLERLGEILGRKERATRVADSLQTKLETMQQNMPDTLFPTVLMMISREKFFVYGKDSYASDMLEKAGGRNALDSVLHNPFPVITEEYILYLNPDIIIAEEQVQIEMGFFEMYPALKKTKAFQNRRFYSISPDLVSRPGPRVIEGIEALKKLIYPDAD